MTDIYWIKITTSMFEDEKIRIIEKMPDGDTILVIWIKLLTLAGRVNAGGYILLTENIPYTEDMLAVIFDRQPSTVQLALRTFQKFGMIEISEDNLIVISNWEKHQNIEGLEKIREQNRLRKQKQRANQTLLLNKGLSRDSHIKVTPQSKTKIENKKKEKELEKEANGDKPHPSQVKEVLIAMQAYYGFPDKTDIDPIPNYGKEGKAIKRMIARGFTIVQIVDCWMAKCKSRGQFVTMVYVNEDIESAPAQSMKAEPKYNNRGYLITMIYRAQSKTLGRDLDGGEHDKVIQYVDKGQKDGKSDSEILQGYVNLVRS